MRFIDDLQIKGFIVHTFYVSFQRARVIFKIFRNHIGGSNPFGQLSGH